MGGLECTRSGASRGGVRSSTHQNHASRRSGRAQAERQITGMILPLLQTAAPVPPSVGWGAYGEGDRGREMLMEVWLGRRRPGWERVQGICSFSLDSLLEIWLVRRRPGWERVHGTGSCSLTHVQGGTGGVRDCSISGGTENPRRCGGLQH